MIEARRQVPSSIEQVFAVLADGWSYGHWVVGSTHIRAVDAGWPQVGTRIHYSVGAWPVTVQQTTTVCAVDPPHRIELEAELQPLGSAWICIELAAVGAYRTEVTMCEKLVRGPGRFIAGPVQALALYPRNTESLRRLGELVSGHYGH